MIIRYNGLKIKDIQYNNINMIQKNRRNSNLITISREFYNLTHIINKNIPVYPGDPKPTFEPVTTIGKDANTNITRIAMGSYRNACRCSQTLYARWNWN